MSRLGAALRGGLPAWAPLGVLALVLAEASFGSARPALSAAALVLLLVFWRSTPRALAVVVALAWGVQAVARVHLHLDARARPARVQARLQGSLERLEERKQELISLVQTAAARAARLRDVPASLAGDPAALRRLFRELELLRDDLQTLRGDISQRPALALHVGAGSAAAEVLAWSGRIGDPAVPPGAGERRDVVVLEGSVSTTLVAIEPVRGPDGAVRGFVSALMPLAARRNIRNEFLRDFDLLAGSDPGLEIRYLDARASADTLDDFPPLDPALEGRQALLRAPDRDPIAAARATAPGLPQARLELESRYRRALAAVMLVALGLWAAAGRAGALRWAAGLTVARAALLYLGPPAPGPGSPLASAEPYASDLLGRVASPLGPLLRSPLDLLLTGAWLAALAALAARAAVQRAHTSSSPWRTALAALASLPVLGGVFYLVADTVANSSLDLETLLLVPRSTAHLVMHVSLLALVAMGALVVVALFALAGPWPAARRRRLLWLALWLVPAFLAQQLWSQAAFAPPPLAALTLYAVAATAGAGAAAIRSWLRRTGAGAQAGLAIVATAVLAAVLYPSVVHFTDRNTRLQIERRYAQEVVAQPEVRRYVIADARRRIDALKLLEETPSGPRRPGLEELAFYAWSNTELALRGMSSAIEVQDASGALVSRFSLNLPSLFARPLPSNENWREDEQRLGLGSLERNVLHARRLLSYHGAVHGAVHVFVADDYWNLPFLRGRDPYSELFRTRPARDRPVAFLSWQPDGQLTFKSTERGSPLPPPPARNGSWTAVELDGEPHEAFVFTSPQGIHMLATPRLTPGVYAANLVEAVAALTLLGLAAVLLAVLARTALRRPTLTVPSLVRAGGERFVRRLLLAFLAVAVVPVVVLQLLVNRFVSDRLNAQFLEQARERAEVARKVTVDYVRYRRAEEGAGAPVDDAPLVWIADTIDNDLDLFQRGRLVASSKRELYDAGLLPRRVSGAVYREVILEGQPFYARPEKIGALGYQVASVPVQLEPEGEPWVLSLPLVLPQREVDATVADVQRRIRLASVLFLALAAILAQSMARRISGPITHLTEAARRIAQGDLDTRVEATSRDELRRLVEAFNQMAGDLERQRSDLERSNRLAAWAEMARQVAHEVKNPLTPIQLSAEHLRRVWRDRTVELGPTLEACTEAILEQVRTLREIVTEFSAFARPPAAVLERQDVGSLVAEVVRPYLPGLPPGVELRQETAPALPPVLADRRLFERAVVNLLENALHAVGERGTVHVRLRPAEEGRRVELEVQDTGAGLDPDVRDRVFEPFFSTKTSGSGLGLPLVKKMAEDHGGGVRLESEPGNGTRAILWLPAAAAHPAGADPEPERTEERQPAAQTPTR